MSSLGDHSAAAVAGKCPGSAKTRPRQEAGDDLSVVELLSHGALLPIEEQLGFIRAVYLRHSRWTLKFLHTIQDAQSHYPQVRAKVHLLAHTLKMLQEMHGVEIQPSETRHGAATASEMEPQAFLKACQEQLRAQRKIWREILGIVLDLDLIVERVVFVLGVADRGGDVGSSTQYWSKLASRLAEFEDDGSTFEYQLPVFFFDLMKKSSIRSKGLRAYDMAISTASRFLKDSTESWVSAVNADGGICGAKLQANRPSKEGQKGSHDGKSVTDKTLEMVSHLTCQVREVESMIRKLEKKVVDPESRLRKLEDETTSKETGTEYEEDSEAKEGKSSVNQSRVMSATHHLPSAPFADGESSEDFPRSSSGTRKKQNSRSEARPTTSRVGRKERGNEKEFVVNAGTSQAVGETANAAGYGSLVGPLQKFVFQMHHSLRLLEAARSAQFSCLSELLSVQLMKVLHPQPGTMRSPGVEEVALGWDAENSMGSAHLARSPKLSLPSTTPSANPGNLRIVHGSSTPGLLLPAEVGGGARQSANESSGARPSESIGGEGGREIPFEREDSSPDGFDRGKHDVTMDEETDDSPNVHDLLTCLRVGKPDWASQTILSTRQGKHIARLLRAALQKSAGHHSGLFEGLENPIDVYRTLENASKVSETVRRRKLVRGCRDCTFDDDVACGEGRTMYALCIQIVYVCRACPAPWLRRIEQMFLDVLPMHLREYYEPLLKTYVADRWWTLCSSVLLWSFLRLFPVRSLKNVYSAVISASGPYSYADLQESVCNILHRSLSEKALMSLSYKKVPLWPGLEMYVDIRRNVHLAVRRRREERLGQTFDDELVQKVARRGGAPLQGMSGADQAKLKNMCQLVHNEFGTEIALVSYCVHKTHLKAWRGKVNYDRWDTQDVAAVWSWGQVSITGDYRLLHQIQPVRCEILQHTGQLKCVSIAVGFVVLKARCRQGYRYFHIPNVHFVRDFLGVTLSFADAAAAGLSLNETVDRLVTPRGEDLELETQIRKVSVFEATLVKRLDKDEAMIPIFERSLNKTAYLCTRRIEWESAVPLPLLAVVSACSHSNALLQYAYEEVDRKEVLWHPVAQVRSQGNTSITRSKENLRGYIPCSCRLKYPNGETVQAVGVGTLVAVRRSGGRLQPYCIRPVHHVPNFPIPLLVSEAHFTARATLSNKLSNDRLSPLGRGIDKKLFLDRDFSGLKYSQIFVMGPSVVDSFSMVSIA